MTSQDNRSITLRFLAEPSDVNFGGNVHGGTVMKWIDQAGYACATGWSAEYCVTAFVGNMRFLKPIKIGSLVEVRGNVILTGNTSMHISVDVYASNARKINYEKTTHCVAIFVSVDSKGTPIEVKKWTPISSEDQKLEQYAQKLMAYRKDLQEAIESYVK